MTAVKGLVMGRGLTLPLDTATSSLAILGSSGSGKSNTVVRFFEQLVKNGIPAVAIDPKGDWWGIRTSGDGNGAGLSVPIFGGLRGDAPLEPGMGVAMAELLVRESLSALIDVSRLGVNNRARFLIDFLHRLFELHQEDPHPRHVVVEEAHRLIPQQLPKGEVLAAQLKEAAAKVVLEGRSFGLGFSAPSQRSARLNNDVLEEVRTLIVHRTGGPADQDAIRRWVRYHNLKEEVMTTLADLGDGEAWVWSPQYLGIVGKFQMYRRSTFDSGATPKVGEKRRTARLMADVDMGAIKEQLGEALARAEASDPTRLRARILVLERSLTAARAAAPPAPETVVETVTVTEYVDRPVLDDAQLVLLQQLVDRLGTIGDSFATVHGGLAETVAILSEGLAAVAAGPPALPPAPTVATATPARNRPHREVITAHKQAIAAAMDAVDGGEELSDGDLAVLGVLAAFPDGRTRKQLGLLAGQAHSGGAFNRRMKRLRDAALIEPPGPGDRIVATAEGRRRGAGGGIALPPPGPALVEHWQGKLPAGPARVLGALAYAWPGDLTNATLADAAGFTAGGGAFNRATARLRAMDLVDPGDGPGRHRLATGLMA